MTRLIGILTGSAIAVAFLIVALGIPEFAAPTTSTSAVSEPTFSEPLKQAVYESNPMPEPTAEQSAIVEQVAETEATSTAEMESQGIDAQADPETVLAETQDSVQEIPDQQWYAFWSPFRSKIAADGFVSQLQRTTGLDYRVVKLKPGVYEVAFAYSDDSDIQGKLTQISTAAGLDLSGG